MSAAFFYFAYRELRNPLYDAHNDHLHGDIFATSTQVQSVESALCDVMYYSFFFLSMYISMNLDIFNLIYYPIHIQFNKVFYSFKGVMERRLDSRKGHPSPFMVEDDDPEN